MIEFNSVFIDTAPLIYFLEQNPKYYTKAKAFIEKCYEDKKRIWTSTITIEEYCVYPYYNNDLVLIEKLDQFISDMEMNLVNIDEIIAKKAAQIRAKYKDFKAMDALQLATACISGCDLFLTNDKQLRQFKEIKCITVDEWR